MEKEYNIQDYEPQMVKDSLTRAFDELAEAKRTGRQLPDARNLFRESGG